MRSAPTLINELESTMRHGSSTQRAEILQRVTQLFLQNANSYRDEHIALFEDVMMRLIERIEQQALVRLSAELAPVASAPTNVVHRLARDDDIAVSRPVLQQSPVLADDFLVEIAQSKSQEHLLAIAARTRVAEQVTDVLVERGNPAVTLKIAGNTGARFSNKSMTRVADRARSDSNLAEVIVRRPDIPQDVFEHLLSKATEVVRQRLIKNAAPDMRAKINQTLNAITQRASAGTPRGAASGGAHSAATLQHQDMARLKSMLVDFARAGDRPQIIDTLSALSKLPVEAIRGLLRAETVDGVLILCKAVGLGWPDVKSILAVMAGTGADNATGAKRSFDKYYNLSEDTATRVLRFVKSCKAVSKADLQRML